MSAIYLSHDQAAAVAAMHRRELVHMQRTRRLRFIRAAGLIGIVLAGCVGAKLFARAAAPGADLSHGTLHNRSGR